MGEGKGGGDVNFVFTLPLIPSREGRIYSFARVISF
jgi:hypothetical protein